MRHTNLSAALVIAVLLLLVPAARADDEAEKRAVEAAEKWLTLVDKGDYAESWETASVLFRKAVSQNDWEQALSKSRGLFGNMISRELMQAKYETSLPGAPDGEYVIIQFRAAFEKKSAAVETVTPMKDPDGEWRVSGYYIK